MTKYYIRMKLLYNRIDLIFVATCVKRLSISTDELLQSADALDMLRVQQVFAAEHLQADYIDETIKETIGYIVQLGGLDDWEFHLLCDILRSDDFKRLGYVHHTGVDFARGHYSRMEHSIGVGIIALQLELDFELVLSAFLHDLGHAPFAHTWEEAIDGERTRDKFCHKANTERLVTSEQSKIAQLLRDAEIDVEAVLSFMQKRRPNPVTAKGKIITIDRIEGLFRLDHLMQDPNNFSDFFDYLRQYVAEKLPLLRVQDAELWLDSEQIALDVFQLVCLNAELMLSAPAILAEHLGRNIITAAYNLDIVSMDDACGREIDIVDKILHSNIVELRQLAAYLWLVIPEIRRGAKTATTVIRMLQDDISADQKGRKSRRIRRKGYLEGPKCQGRILDIDKVGWGVSKEVRRVYRNGPTVFEVEHIMTQGDPLSEVIEALQGRVDALTGGGLILERKPSKKK